MVLSQSFAKRYWGSASPLGRRVREVALDREADAAARKTKRRRIVRAVIHEVVADIDDTASEIVLLLHWIGGAHTERRVTYLRVLDIAGDAAV